MNYLSNLNLNMNELQNAVIQVVATDPTTGNKKGRVIFNSTENAFKYYDGSKWVNPALIGSDPNTITVAKGGTGATSLTAGQVLVGNGTKPVTTKAIDTAPTANSTNLITSGGVKKYVDDELDAAIAAVDSMKFMGTIGADGTITSGDASVNGKKITALTQFKIGWTFKASAAIPNSVIATDTPIESGDVIIVMADASSYSVDNLTVIQANIDGYVTGPTSATDGALVAFDGTSGKLIKVAGVSVTELQNSINHKHTIAAGTGITVTGGSLSAGGTATVAIKDSGVTAGTYGDNGDDTISVTTNSGSVSLQIPEVTVNAQGQITAASNKEVTINIIAAKKATQENPTLTATSGVCTWTFAHGLNSQYPTVNIYEKSTGAMVLTDVAATDSNTVTIKMNSDATIAAGTYVCVVVG